MEQMMRGLAAYRKLPGTIVGVLAVAAIMVLFFGIHLAHVEGTGWGWLSLLPTILVLAAAIASRRPFESLVIGSLAGLVMLSGGDIVPQFTDNLSQVMGNETIIWIVLVCGLMGSLIALLEHSGSLNSFSEWLGSRIGSQRQSLVTTVAIGLVVFIDDYLNCLAVSSSVKKVTDTFGVSREKLAYLIDSTAAPMCVIVPISTWAVFFSGLLEENGLADQGMGLSIYISAIPFMAYAWCALGLVILVAIGVVGDIGPMRKAERRAREGQPVPPDFEGSEFGADVYEGSRPTSSGRGMFNFLFLMLLLVLATIYYEIDLLRGVILTLGATVLLFSVQRLLSFGQQMEAVFDGFKVMLYPLSTVIAGFILKNINDDLGMTTYVIESLTPLMSREMLPAIVFASLSLVVFGTASSWGTFIIAIPIVVPIASGVDANIPLVVGALLSAASFGSHACFFSDSSVLAAQGAGCSPISHAFTQFPYALIGAICAFLAFVALGYAVA